MKDGLLRWWPVVPALAILYLGGMSFFEKYPRAGQRLANRAGTQGTPDSLLVFLRQETDKAVSPDSGALNAGNNPFRPIHQPRPAGQGASSVRSEPPPRRFVLKGTVGSNVATIANHAGQKQIVKVGDSIDSAEVVSIEANKVVLKDRGGRFELLNEK